ncbi:MAG TPA: Na/Pi cotransporter, partial [Ruminococcus sp.]|nr:Na/Pi cotransporter [Ruminococcus sp.]
DFERISDHAMNMVSVAEEKQQKDLNFTSQATAEVKVMCSAVRDVLDIAMEAFEKHDLELATRVEPLEEVVDKIRTKLKNRHVKRLQTGECTIEMGFVFSDLLTNLERVSDHCSNIAVCLIQENDESFDVHEYVQMLKNSGEGFDGQVKRYSEKYALPAKEF